MMKLKEQKEELQKREKDEHKSGKFVKLGRWSQLKTSVKGEEINGK